MRKGQLEFAQAACQVLKNDQAERKVKFLIIGEQKDISYTKRVREVIKEFGYEKEIVLIPETEKINDYYCMTDMFVCNSYIESFPRVILEAMAFSLPIVATNVYGIPEQIRDGKEGLLIMPGDVNDLAKKMELLLERQEKAKEMGQKARERVEKDFTYKKMIKRYEDIIQEVCEAK